jgi:predicted nucleic acid-binding protein
MDKVVRIMYLPKYRIKHHASYINRIVIPITERSNKQRADKEWSLTDCASFKIMKARGITEALAHDHHFEQAGFTALLRP